MIHLPKEGSIVEFKVETKEVTGTISEYLYGLSGAVTGFVLEGLENQRWGVDFLENANVIYEPVEETEDIEFK